MGHYMLNFLVTTGFMVILLYGVYFYLKSHPNLTGMAQVTPQAKGKGLKVHSSMSLEPRKRLHVVGYGEQRFLVATTMDKTELLATLESEPEPEPQVDASPMGLTSQPGLASPIDPSAGFMERFRYSLKMVFADRFTRSGEK